MVSIISIKSKKLSGEVFVPGDKSISHRALILGACAIGKTTIENLLESEDVLATLSALKELGVNIKKRKSNGCKIMKLQILTKSKTSANHVRRDPKFVENIYTQSNWLNAPHTLLSPINLYILYLYIYLTPKNSNCVLTHIYINIQYIF